MFLDKRCSIVLLVGTITLIGIENCGAAGGTAGSVNDLSDANIAETINGNGEVVNPYCTKDEECDDGIDCTVDACLQGNCKYIPDNNKCGAGQICDVAKVGCVKAKSCFSKEDCNDYLECTVEGCDSDTNTCQYIYDDSRCPDGYICFVPPDYYQYSEKDDTDEISGCSPTKRCKADKDCAPEETSCAIGTCIVDVCVYSADYAFCDDGDVCNGYEGCSAAGSMDSSNACNIDGTYYPPVPDYCSHYNCYLSEPLTCNDNNHCTNDSCDPQNGCVFTNNNKSCEDGEICTENDHCEDGACASGFPKDCDDKNSCTNDYCKSGEVTCGGYDAIACPGADTVGGPGPGCNHEPIMESESCDTPCIKNGICSSGKCSEGTPVDCDDKNPCTQDSCDSLKGCVNKVAIECGPDEKCCGESCCSSEQVCYDNYYCCSPDCVDKNCGDDGCDGSCGECIGQDICIDSNCVCQPNCVDKECGDDGCGGDCTVLCKECENAGQCLGGGNECVILASGAFCATACGTNTDCPSGFFCMVMFPQGQCIPKAYDCPPEQYVCVNGTFVCQPDCADKQCGDDGCGGSCGKCECGTECQSGKCVFTACADKQCGDDGCGGSCGKCLSPCECIDAKCDSIRWIDNGNQTITDCQTKYVWQKKAEVEIPWQEAIDYCYGLELSGGGWSLPTMGELGTLLVFPEDNDWPFCHIDPIFEGPCDSYWTSTEDYIQDTGWVYYIIMFSAYSDVFAFNDPYYSYYVRCVHSGQ